MRVRDDSDNSTPQPRGARAWWHRRSRLFRRTAALVLLVAILQPIVGFLLVPWLIRSVVIPRISGRLQGSLTLVEARFNPYTWRLELDGLALTDPEGRLAAGWTKAEIDFNPLSSLLLPGWRFNDVILTDPYVDAVNTLETGLNIERIFAFRSGDPDEAGGASNAPIRVPRFIVGGLEIRNGRAAIDDRTFAMPVVSRVAGVTFRVEDLDTTPVAGVGAENLHSLVATTDSGARISWTGTLSLDPPSSRGAVHIRDLALAQVAAYATRFTDVRVSDGRADLVLTYHLAPVQLPPTDDGDPATPPLPAPDPIVRATIAHASIVDLVTDRAGGPLAAVPSVTVRGVDVDAIRREAVVASLEAEGGSLFVERDASGTLNLARMIRERPAAPSVAAPLPSSAAGRAPRADVLSMQDPAQQFITSLSYLLEDIAGAWDVRVEDVRLRGLSIDAIDRSPDEEVRATLREVSLDAGPFRSVDDFEIPFAASATLNGAPSAAGGRFEVRARTLDIDASTEGLDITPFAPYLRLVDARPLRDALLDGGSLRARGHLSLSTPTPDRIRGTWDGSVGIASLVSHERRTDASAPPQALLSLALLDARGEASLDSSTVDGVRVRWDGTLLGEQVAIGPAALQAAGVDDGSVRSAGLLMEGSVDLHLTPDGVSAGDEAAATPTPDAARGAERSSGSLAPDAASWKGTMDLKEAVLQGLAIAPERGESISGSVSAIHLDGSATLRRLPASALSAEWSGEVGLEEFVGEASGATHAAIRSARATLQGEASGSLSADRTIALAWKGTSALGESSLAIDQNVEGPRRLEASVHEGLLEGHLQLRHGGATPTSVTLDGAVTLEHAQAMDAHDGRAVTFEQSRGAAKGTCRIEVEATGGLAVGLKGSATFERSAADSQGDHPLAVVAGGGTVEGTAELRRERDTLELEWDGRGSLRSYRFLDGPRDAPIALVEGEEAHANGAGNATLIHDRRTLDFKGDVLTASPSVAITRATTSLRARASEAKATGQLRAALEGDASALRVLATFEGGFELDRGEFSSQPEHPYDGSVDRVAGRASLVLTANDSRTSVEGTTVTRLDAGRLEAGALGNAFVASMTVDGKLTFGPATIPGGLDAEPSPSDPLAPRPLLASFDGSLLAAGAKGLYDPQGLGIAAEVGTVRYQGHAATRIADGVPTSSLQGGIRLENLSARRGSERPTSGRIRSVALEALTFDEAAAHLGSDRLAVDGLTLEHSLDDAGASSPAADATAAKSPRSEQPGGAAPDGRPAPPAPLSAEALAAQLPWSLRLGELVVTDSAIHLTGRFDGGNDGAPRSVILDQIELTMRDLDTRGREQRSSAENTDNPGAAAAAGAIDLSARLVGSGRVDLEGTLDPFRHPMVADIVLELRDVPLPPADPVAARYVGYRMAGGRLSSRIPATVQSGQVRGTIEFTLDGPEVGERSTHPSAPNLPLGFALAVMRDSNNQVKGTIPFSGDATDPRFTLSGLVIEVILSFIGKIATAPFQLLAAAFAGSDDVDLSSVPFDPGSATLTSEGLKRLDLLAKALAERPSLGITVTGAVATSVDERAIRASLLRDVVLRRAQNAPRARATLDAATYRWLVGVLWRELPAAGDSDPSGAQAPTTTDVSFEQMEAALLETMPFDPSMLRVLAEKRAEAVVAALLGSGIANDRVVTGPMELEGSEPPRAGIGLAAGTSGGEPANASKPSADPRSD